MFCLMATCEFGCHVEYPVTYQWHYHQDEDNLNEPLSHELLILPENSKTLDRNLESR